MPGTDELAGATAAGSELSVAAAGISGGAAALLSAAACCVLPLALAALGLGTGALAALVPYHWPLTIISALVIAAGWLLYMRKRRACARGDGCAASSSRTTAVILSLATSLVILSAIWPSVLEAPLMAWLE